jgi:hypothetical protein
MHRIAAGANSAEVIDVIPFRDFADEQLMCQTIRLIRLSPPSALAWLGCLWVSITGTNVALPNHAGFVAKIGGPLDLNLI